jgi:hypothetical protein
MANAREYNYPGQVDFEFLKLISSNGLVVDLNDYLIEFNLVEDIFSNFLHGQILINDSNNILSKLPIIGDEILIVSYGTPSLQSYFRKVFHVYSVTDQTTVSDNNTQTYILHFCSIEAAFDANIAVYKSFNGNVSDVAFEIYETYLKNDKYVKFTETSIESSDSLQSQFLYSETQNKLKFISPGWSPAKCINWLCSKAIPRDGKACDFLFWESTAGFFFSSIEDLMFEAEKTNKVAGEYYYIPAGNFESSDVFKQLFMAQSFQVVNFNDNLKNYLNGFYANKIITFDPITKKYASKDFDYPTEYDNFTHTEGKLSVAPFAKEVFRNSDSYVKIYPSNAKLFSGITNNYTERMIDIFGNRHTKLSELDNFKINLTVHGRSDLYAGSMIKFNFPDTTNHESSNDFGNDKLYSGTYLVSTIRHKINFRNHVMILELIKDSFAKKS